MVVCDDGREFTDAELRTMSISAHNNIVKLYEAFMFGNQLSIVMEYAGAGSLTDFLSNRNAGHESQIAYILREILEGLAYMHEMGLIHRDIKSNNVLLTRHGGVKIADFGFVANLTATMHKPNRFMGTPYWMAPEICRDEEYDEKVDVWALGIVAYECAEGAPPLAHETTDRAVERISAEGPPALTAPHKWSTEFRHFIAMCTVLNPLHRASAVDLLRHPFLHCAARQDHMGRVFSAAVVKNKNPTPVARPLHAPNVHPPGPPPHPPAPKVPPGFPPRPQVRTAAPDERHNQAPHAHPPAPVPHSRTSLVHQPMLLSAVATTGTTPLRFELPATVNHQCIKL